MLDSVGDLVESALRAAPADRGARVAVVAVRTSDRAECEAFVRTGSGAACRADSPFLLYSITKTFLAAAALRLVARGVLGLDAPVAGWLPSAPHGDQITLRHLLQHTSGLPDYGGLPAYHAAVRAGDAPWPDGELLSWTQAAELRFPPGEGWAYSNVGYLLVRRLIEAASAAPVGDVLRAELLEPLALHATFTPTDADLPRLILGPSAYLGDPAVPVDGRYHLGWVTHGVLASTAADVARFLEALLGGEVLPPRLLGEMRRLREVGPVAGHPFSRPAYGLGLMADADGGAMGHSGGGPGASTAVYRREGGRGPATVAVLTDGEDGGAERLAVAVLARLSP